VITNIEKLFQLFLVKSMIKEGFKEVQECMEVVVGRRKRGSSINRKQSC
jgi:hypothetical protein